MKQLFDLDGAAGSLDLGLDGGRLVLAHAFLDRRGHPFHQVLGLFQAKRSNGADFLDDLDLLIAGAGQNDIEFGFLLGGSGLGGGSGHGHGDWRRCGNTELLLKLV